VCRIERGEPAQVREAAAIFQNLCYNYRDQMTAGIIVAGWDSRLGGQVYSVPLGGMLVRQEVCIGGSGAGFIYGFVDSNFQPKMTKENAEKFVQQGKSYSHTLYSYTKVFLKAETNE